MALGPIDVLHRAQDDSEELANFINLCAVSIINTQAAPRLIEQVKQVSLRFDPKSKYHDPEYSRSRQQSAAEVAKRAEMQIREGIPHLYRYATVWLWTIFEASIDDFCVAFLLEDERWRTIQALADVKGSLLEFAVASEESRVILLLEAVKQHVRAPLKVGVGRFEEVLKLIGLGGGVHEDVRKVILEFIETRNVLLHRQGFADRDFVERCPWLGLRIGAQVVVSRWKYRAFVFCMAAYHLELAARLAEADGAEESREASEEMRATMHYYLEGAARGEEGPDGIE